MKFIIKPFSEIIVKSKPVRKKYLDHLQNNCNLALRRIDETLKVKVFWDKLELETKDKRQKPHPNPLQSGEGINRKDKKD
jgi:thiamine biosynthesis protein ThiI